MDNNYNKLYESIIILVTKDHERNISEWIDSRCYTSIFLNYHPKIEQ